MAGSCVGVTLPVLVPVLEPVPVPAPISASPASVAMVALRKNRAMVRHSESFSGWLARRGAMVTL